MVAHSRKLDIKSLRTLTSYRKAGESISSRKATVASLRLAIRLMASVNSSRKKTNDRPTLPNR